MDSTREDIAKRADDQSSKEKRELLRMLKREHIRWRKRVNYNQIVILVEMKKLDEKRGFLKCEYHDGGVPSFVGSLLLPIEPSNAQSSVWDNINPGNSRFFGIALDTREKTFGEQATGFIKRTFEDAKLQDFLPWPRKNPTA